MQHKFFIMKKTFIIAALTFCCHHLLFAQTEKTYYRIMSAKSEFKDKCIEDHTNNSNGSDDYLINDWEAGNLNQEWELIPNSDSTSFYIRNRYSRRFIGNTTSVVNERFFYTPNGLTQSSSPTWTLTALDNGQTLISTQDPFGATRFLNATNTSHSPERIYILNNAKNTGFAWYIIDASIDPTAVKDVVESPIKVSVLNRQIIVSGSRKFSVFNLQGHPVPTDRELIDGIYLVKVKDHVFKISIH